MAITKSLAKKAHRMVCTLEEIENGAVMFWTPHKLEIFGINPTEVVQQMEAAQALTKQFPDLAFHHSPDNKRMVNVETEGKWLSTSYRTPHELLTMFKEGAGFDHTFDPSGLMPNEPDPDTVSEHPIEDLHATHQVAEMAAQAEVERIGGVPTNGAIAHKEGIAAADCPYSSEDEAEYADFERWNREWDEAADAAEEGEEQKGGSVVKDKYRAIYAERGHPAHCGDWLATILNNLCIANGQTDMERVKAIYEANGVNMSKYKTSGNGWQGRYRMTGRNLLARKLFSAEFLIAPDMNGDMIKYPVPQEWKDAQTYVKEAPVGQVTPQAAS